MFDSAIVLIVFKHDGDTVTCALGEPIRRERPAMKRGERDYSRQSALFDDGGRVSLIEDAGGYYLIHYELQPGERCIWENPFMAGKHQPELCAGRAMLRARPKRSPGVANGPPHPSRTR